MQDIALQACGCGFTISCPDERTAGLVHLAFAGLIVAPSRDFAVERRYRIAPRSGPSFAVFSAAGVTEVPDADGLLFHLEKDVTLAVQRRRRDLFFLHGAAVSWSGRAAALAAPSGTGKSTLAIAALERGFAYLSDELAPIDARTRHVHPFPSAPCLKLPAQTGADADLSSLGGRLRVPLESVPRVASRTPQPLGAIVFLRRDRDRVPERVRRLTPASAAARLMENALNPLAHGGSGLDAAAVIAESVPAFELDVHETGPAVEALRSCLAPAASGARRHRTSSVC